jgi:hypothetical protein
MAAFCEPPPATAWRRRVVTTARTTKTDEPALFPLPLLPPSRGPDPQRHVPRPAASTKPTKANAAMHPVVMSEQAFCAPEIQAAAFYADENVLIFNMEVCKALPGPGYRTCRKEFRHPDRAIGYRKIKIRIAIGGEHTTRICRHGGWGDFRAGDGRAGLDLSEAASRLPHSLREGPPP